MLEVGRFHTDIGYWNTAFHHGLWLQIPVERPHVLRFEDDGGLVPVHWVGGAYTLETVSPAGEYRYERIESIREVIPYAPGLAAMVARSSRHVMTKGRYRQPMLLALPLTIWFYGCWIAGETAGLAGARG